MSFLAKKSKEPPALTQSEAEVITRLARDRSGLVIAPEKTSFLELRLSRRLQELRLRDYSAYIARLSGPHGDTEAQIIVEALTTHTTAFFRERAQFEWLANHGFAQLAAGGAGQSRELVIWSAACSIGAELWSAGMILDRFSKSQEANFRWSLTGSDISLPILQRAEKAIFTESEIAPLDEDMRHAYLMRSRSLHFGKTLYRIAPNLRERARFFLTNLVMPRAERPPVADVIFLRNVLIYFDAIGRKRALTNAISRLSSGGFLLTGHAESLQDVPAGLTTIAPSIYRKD
jgi:chemotaxis protein methyltransferase CheR